MCIWGPQVTNRNGPSSGSNECTGRVRKETTKTSTSTSYPYSLSLSRRCSGSGLHCGLTYTTCRVTSNRLRFAVWRCSVLPNNEERYLACLDTGIRFTGQPYTYFPSRSRRSISVQIEVDMEVLWGQTVAADLQGEFPAAPNGQASFETTSPYALNLLLVIVCIVLYSPGLLHFVKAILANNYNLSHLLDLICTWSMSFYGNTKLR